MHKLVRVVRFSVNPFLQQDSAGFNSFCSKPAGEGMSIFFELAVELTGQVQPATGFVVNVTDIDRIVRENAVPMFGERIRADYRKGRHIGFAVMAQLLHSTGALLKDKIGWQQPALPQQTRVSKLSLQLNPFRKFTIDPRAEDRKMVYFSEKFEFAATHRLWNPEFSDSKNREVFGRCANPAGHGHNYIIEVTVKTAANGDFRIGDFERTVDEQVIKHLDHKNLNADVAQFRHTNPTVENLAVFGWEKLVGKFGQGRLHCVTVWENDRTCSSYFGQSNDTADKIGKNAV